MGVVCAGHGEARRHVAHIGEQVRWARWPQPLEADSVKTPRELGERGQSQRGQEIKERQQMLKRWVVVVAGGGRRGREVWEGRGGGRREGKGGGGANHLMTGCPRVLLHSKHTQKTALKATENTEKRTITFAPPKTPGRARSSGKV